MNGFTVRVCRTFAIMGVGLTVFATAVTVALARRHTPQQHLSHAVAVIVPFVGLVLFGGIFAFIFGGTTRVDARGIRALRLGVGLPCREGEHHHVRPPPSGCRPARG
jgi:hypothetical protein